MMYQGHQPTSRVFAAFTAVVAFHIIAIVAFKSGLIRDILPLPPPKVIEATFIEEIKPPPPPPPAPRREVVQEQITVPEIIELPPIELPPVENVIQVPTSIDAVVGRETDQPTGEGPQITEFMPDSRYPLSKPNYPPPSVRLNEQGVVTLMIYVLPNGRVGEARIDKSSGYRRLDESAIREALRSWRFKPRTVGGQPVAAWGTYKVRFTLDDG